MPSRPRDRPTPHNTVTRNHQRTSPGPSSQGIFLCAHVLFCRIDPTECLWNNGRTTDTGLWGKLQKSVAFVCCCAGVAIYTLGRGSAAEQHATAELKRDGKTYM